MKAHAAVSLALSVVAVASCGGHQSVEINPDTQPVASRWNGVLATPAELAGIVQVRGQAWMGPHPKDVDRTQTYSAEVAACLDILEQGEDVDELEQEIR